ncbi:MAG TPA: SIR2 family protein [Epulopiscium sp.]|nr:SIR2 family protein [Candidatus Epulonipiscium sp.]
MHKVSHDPKQYIRGLQQLLVSDKKKIAFLFGAGTSLGKKNLQSITIPAMSRLTKEIGEALCANNKFQIALEEIKVEIGSEEYNIETLLSNIEQKKHIIGKGKLNGLEKPEFECLLRAVKNQVRKKVSAHEHILKGKGIDNLIHVDFAEWIGRADRINGIEVFTTNYDYLFELGLEEKNIPYYDGFTGSYMPFFNSQSVEDLYFLPKQTKLWKIHGSLGWQLDEERKKVLRKDSDSNDILIYPSILKYADSRKQPYVALIDRLTKFLKEPDTILITCGYSFSDEHINERILTALKSNTTAHVYGLYYDRIWRKDKDPSYGLTPDSKIAKMAAETSKITILGCRNAVIGSQYGTWKLTNEPNCDDTIEITLYFDEDAPFNITDEMNTIKKGKELWTGEGELVIPDFAKFVAFLKSVIPNSELVGEGQI